VNCQKKEFADRSKRSLSSKERAIFGGSLLSDVRKNEWTKDTHYWKQDTWPISFFSYAGHGRTVAFIFSISVQQFSTTFF
jgi:hypothetical protein